MPRTGTSDVFCSQSQKVSISDTKYNGLRTHVLRTPYSVWSPSLVSVSIGPAIAPYIIRNRSVRVLPVADRLDRQFSIVLHLARIRALRVSAFQFRLRRYRMSRPMWKPPCTCLGVIGRSYSPLLRYLPRYSLGFGMRPSGWLGHVSCSIVRYSEPLTGLYTTWY